MAKDDYLYVLSISQSHLPPFFIYPVSRYLALYVLCRGDGSLIAKSCLTLCDPIDYSLLASSVLGFSRQESWSVLPFPSPGDLSDPGIEPLSPAWVSRFFIV